MLSLLKSVYRNLADNKETILLHFPVGFFCSLMTSVSTPHGISLTAGFIVYEVIEDWRIKDNSYRDVLGFLLGYGFHMMILLGRATISI